METGAPQWAVPLPERSVRDFIAASDFYHTMKRVPFILSLGCVLLMTGCGTMRSWFGMNEIYDEKADGEQQLVKALTRAAHEQKRVLLSFGANWCGDSQAMFHLLQTDRDIQRELQTHYILAMVDANPRAEAPRNTNTVARFGTPLSRGIPVLLVLTPEGKLLNDDPEERLADSDHQHPKVVLAYLQKWAATNGPSK
jgi:thiol:disulfide interchange protein